MALGITEVWSFAGHLDGWMPKSGPFLDSHHSPSKARAFLLPAPVSRGRLCCVWLQELEAELGIGFTRRGEGAPFKSSWVWEPLAMPL